MCSGETIIAETDLVVPYSKILTYGIMLIVPLSIGVAITRWLPRLSALLVKCMKPMAFFLIVFILVCGIWSQFFMIKLITWKVAVVGFGLPWMGFAFGCLFSKLCRRERKDIIAIAIETGIQNTGKVMQIRFSNFLEHLFVKNLPVVICALFHLIRYV
jgi:predicted Na+-dependent transporter